MDFSGRGDVRAGREVFFVTVSTMRHPWDRDNPPAPGFLRDPACFFTHPPYPRHLTQRQMAR